MNFLDAEDGLDRKVARLNALRRLIAKHSPFESEPVDLIEWVPADTVHANDYNPNIVAPPEMELLRLSILADGYTHQQFKEIRAARKQRAAVEAAEQAAMASVEAVFQDSFAFEEIQ